MSCTTENSVDGPRVGVTIGVLPAAARHASRDPYSDTAWGGGERVNQDPSQDANPQSHTWAPGPFLTKELYLSGPRRRRA